MDNSEQPAFHVAHGLTKREYFAAMALQGLLAKRGNEYEPSQLAAIAVEQAFHLMKELERGK